MEQTLKLKNSEKKDYHYEEAIKTLRTNIQFCGSSLKVIMFTSSLPDEGKSEITFALASSFGSIGKKVLLVDGDIRKSVLVKRYEIKGNPNGLSQYLSGQKPLDKVLYHTDTENLDMILAGPYSPDPAELLEDTLFKDMLEKSRNNYDYIIIDTPPMGSVIDGAIIARSLLRVPVLRQSVPITSSSRLASAGLAPWIQRRKVMPLVLLENFSG